VGGCISFLICLAPALLFFRAGETGWLILTAVNAAANFWSFGVMHNYAIGTARDKIITMRKNLSMEGVPPDEIERRLAPLRGQLDPRAVPDWLSWSNMLTSFLGAGLLVFALLAT
jgi:hypothetical protein